MTITLWGRSSSANVQKVVWTLGELGLAYEHVPIGGRFGGNRTPEYLRLNPNGLVPTLRDGDLVLWESHAIVRYLAATYGAGSLWPEAPSRRALADQWTDWTASTFQPAWLGAFWLVVRTPTARHDSSAIEASLAETERAFALLEQRLALSHFLGGDELTYADIVAGVAMYRWRSMPVVRQQHQAVDAWHGRLRAREAFRAAVEVDYAELVGRLAF